MKVIRSKWQEEDRYGDYELACGDGLRDWFDIPEGAEIRFCAAAERVADSYAVVMGEYNNPEVDGKHYPVTYCDLDDWLTSACKRLDKKLSSRFYVWVEYR